jgi:hypothetical protein
MDAGGRATHGVVAENNYLALEPADDDAMVQLQGHSITYRIAVGPQQGLKVSTLQKLPRERVRRGETVAVDEVVAGIVASDRSTHHRHRFDIPVALSDFLGL